LRDATAVGGVDVGDDPTVLGSDDDEIAIVHPSIVARTIGSCEH
jgi:hypothetical protein